jgi:hypothetical protein
MKVRLKAFFGNDRLQAIFLSQELSSPIFSAPSLHVRLFYNQLILFIKSPTGDDPSVVSSSTN